MSRSKDSASRVDLAGREILVTGAGGGIGRIIVRRLVRSGASVTALDADKTALAAHFQDDPHVRPLVARLGEDAATEIVAELAALGVSIDSVVNGVGIDSNRSLAELTEADLRRTFDVNVIGPWSLTKALLLPRAQAGQSGSAVFVTSLHQWFTRGHADYSSSKAAAGMLVREMARELGPHVRVNAVAPGAVNLHEPGSELHRYEEDRARSLVPLGRLGRPEDVAWQVAVLLDDELSGYVTGSTVVVDGGLSLHTWLDDLYASATDERRQNRLE